VGAGPSFANGNRVPRWSRAHFRAAVPMISEWEPCRSRVGKRRKHPVCAKVSSLRRRVSKPLSDTPQWFDIVANNFRCAQNRHGQDQTDRSPDPSPKQEREGYAQRIELQTLSDKFWVEHVHGDYVNSNQSDDDDHNSGFVQTVDAGGKWLLTAYNVPSMMTVHPLGTDGAIGVSPQMSTRVWPPPWPSWIEALAPPPWISPTSRVRPDRKRSS